MNDLLKQIKGLVGQVPFTVDAVAMYFCMVDQQTPWQVRGMIAGALTYFVTPQDAIPDILGAIGFTDDASVIAMTLSTIGSAVTDDHKQQAAAFFNP